MFVAMVLMGLGIGVASAEDPVEAARKAAEQSIRDGEQQQLKSKYWQTYKTADFTAVVPSYADAKVAGARWSLDLAGPYTLTITRSDKPVAALGAERLAALGGQQQVADRPGGQVFDVQTAKSHHRVTTRSSGTKTFLVEVQAPAGQLDGAIADRLFGGVRFQ